jgi:hypothetical protein
MPEDPLSIPLLRAALWSAEPLTLGALPPWVDVAVGPPDLHRVEPLQRRRLSPLGRALVHVATRALGERGPTPTVFASRHGDPSRVMPVLTDLVEGQEASPTQFSMNVHNGPAGIWSIATGDRSPSTSLAAGPETLGLALIEGYAQVQAQGDPVLVVYADGPLPPLLAPFEEAPMPLHGIAFLLGEPAVAHLRAHRRPEATPGAEAPAQTPALLAALASGEARWTGPAAHWTWSLDAP